MDLPVIEKAALLLPDTDRALLADRLLTSLDVSSTALRLRWIAEAESRFDAYRSGLIEAVDGPQAMAALHERFGR